MNHTRTALAALAAAIALGSVLAGCGGDSERAPDPAPAPSPAPAAPAPAPAPAEDAEAAWLELLAGRGLTPAAGPASVSALGGAPEISVTISVDADATEAITFSDGLYGAEVYTFGASGWDRVDTADARIEIAPILEPGQAASTLIPVEQADSYRVLLPYDGQAAWADVV